MKKISVVVPVYNVKEYLLPCVESLLRQSYSALEILLIDDGSTDGSGELCDKLAAQDARIHVFHQENSGVSSARNAGLHMATGDYTAFIDPDDWVHDQMYEKMVGLIEQEQADAVFCGYWEKPEEEEITPILHSPDKSGVVSGKEAMYQCLIGMGYGYFTSVWNKMFRTSCLKTENGEVLQFEKNLSIAEDELWLAQVVPKLKRVVLFSEALYYWRQRKGSALHDSCKVTSRWYSALDAKKRVVEQVEKTLDCVELVRGKVYCDLFHLIWYAYYDKDKQAQLFFKKQLYPYKKSFFASDEFSAEKKIRFFVLEAMVALHMPRRAVRYVGELTSYRVKEKIQRFIQKENKAV